MGIFFQKIYSVTHNYIWAPNTMLSFRKKLMSLKILTDKRKDGWQTLFYMTLPAEAGGTIRENNYYDNLNYEL